MNNSGQKARFYLPELDGLRFVAAMLVLIHHLPSNVTEAVPGLTRLRAMGWVGVDLFLSLSAYLLVKLLLLEYESQASISLPRFFMRRILRIWPLYFFFVTICSVYHIYENPDTIRLVLGWFISHLSFSNNILTAVQGYSPVAFTDHLWTISLEEQFYLVLPFALLFLKKRSVNLKICLTVLTAIRLSCYLIQVKHPFVWTLPLRADSLLFGAMIAVTESSRKQLPQITSWFLLGICVYVMLFMLPTISITSLDIFSVYGYSLVGLACSGALIASLELSFLRYTLRWRPFVYFGRISYGLYVYHVFCIEMTKSLFNNVTHPMQPYGMLFSAIFLTITTASISYYAIERPFLLLKKRYTTIVSRPISGFAVQNSSQ